MYKHRRYYIFFPFCFKILWKLKHITTFWLYIKYFKKELNNTISISTSTSKFNIIFCICLKVVKWRYHEFCHFFRGLFKIIFTKKFFITIKWGFDSFVERSCRIWLLRYKICRIDSKKFKRHRKYNTKWFSKYYIFMQITKLHRQRFFEINYSNYFAKRRCKEINWRTKTELFKK